MKEITLKEEIRLAKEELEELRQEFFQKAHKLSKSWGLLLVHTYDPFRVEEYVYLKEDFEELLKNMRHKREEIRTLESLEKRGE